MAKPPYLEKDCVKHYFKSKDHANNKSNNSLSFFASILSLFIYISIFYVFNLSPYTLINNNIFWFFMSNTLILIIAADYGAFSSSKRKQDVYEEYVKHSHARNNGSVSSSSSYVPRYDEQVDKQCISPKKKLGANKLLHEKKEITTYQDSEVVPERVLEIVAQNEEPTKPSECSNEKKSLLPLQVRDGYNKEFEERAIPIRRTFQRSKSDRPRRAKCVVIDERKNAVRTTSTRGSEKVETKIVEEEEENNNEFSRMTNEDLNRRVEEFIQNFNRQIRLQAKARNVVCQT